VECWNVAADGAVLLKLCAICKIFSEPLMGAIDWSDFRSDFWRVIWSDYRSNTRGNTRGNTRSNNRSNTRSNRQVYMKLNCDCAHHAEGRVDPNTQYKKTVTGFEYPRACRFRKYQIENRSWELRLPTFFKT
jgi:hypothetical protein